MIETKRNPRIVKQKCSVTTLVENECNEGKMGTVSQVLELLTAQENFNRETEEMNNKLAAKDDKIVHLKIHSQNFSLEGPGSTEELVVENANL